MTITINPRWFEAGGGGGGGGFHPPPVFFQRIFLADFAFALPYKNLGYSLSNIMVQTF